MINRAIGVVCLHSRLSRDIAGTIVMVLLTFAASPTFAQLNTQHVKGSVGLKGGSQPPPGGYVVAPLLYFYNTDTVKNRDGEDTSVPPLSHRRPVRRRVQLRHHQESVGRLLRRSGAVSSRRQQPDPGYRNRSKPWCRPHRLGHRADPARVALQTGGCDRRLLDFRPTGRYEDGASNNTGFGMWGNELAAGTTVYLTENKQYHAATVLSFDFQSKKEDSETKVGNAMNFEGGVGGDFLKGRSDGGALVLRVLQDQRRPDQGFPRHPHSR